MPRYAAICILYIIIFSSCEKNNHFIEPPLGFSEDTVQFDTVFASIGSITRELRVHNNEKSRITIDEIYLSGGENSNFRINIDGEPVYRKKEVTLEPGDSLFIFIDVLVDPTNVNAPVAIMDSIIFRVSGFIMQVQLLAWGQDIFLLSNKIIKSETWQKSKPYVIYGNVIVDTMETLTIEAGARIYFHRKASLTIAGNLEINGSYSSPVLFASDRLEKEYEDIPGQWEGIFILKTSNGNSINNAIIRNSVFGLTIGESGQGGSQPDMKLFNSSICHSAVTGLSAINSNIEAANCVIFHCGKYCIYLASGGNYSLTHCTVENQWDYGFRLTPSVSVTEKPLAPNSNTSQIDLDLNNSVIFGDVNSELEIIPLTKNLTGNYYFDHCLLKLDTLNSTFWSNVLFPAAIINKDPHFIDPFYYDFRPDSLSPLIDNGNGIYSGNYPFDIRGISRISDSRPDIGAYERVAGEHKEER